MLLINSRRRTAPPATLLILPFDETPLWVMVCFLGAISAIEEAFLRKVFGWEEIVIVNSDLNKSTSLYWIKISFL